MDKYNILIKFNHPLPCLQYIGSYIIDLQMCIKRGDRALLMFYKPFKIKNRMCFNGVKWLTPIAACYVYGSEHLLTIIKQRIQLEVTAYDLYILAQLKRWYEVRQIIENNPDMKFCYQLIYQYALESNAESFIVWLRMNPKFTLWCNDCQRGSHPDEHTIANMRQRYNRMTTPQRGTPWY